MFSGIVTDLGRLKAVQPPSPERDCRMVIQTAFRADELALGASICCSGVCLTVVERGPDWFAVDASAETLGCTTLGGWRPGQGINLERSLKIGDELGGHLVSGHVDGVGLVASLREEGGSLRLEFAAPPTLARYIAAKGSIAVDGVSLTVNEVVDQPDGTARFAINIIPHTRTVTSLGAVKAGDGVNLEVDLVARYVARLLSKD